MEKVMEEFEEMLGNWSRMQSSDMDDAGDDADRFEGSFYRVVEELRVWLLSREEKPKTLDAALALPEVEALSERLPGPLLLNFETELELIVEGLEREQEEKYD